MSFDPHTHHEAISTAKTVNIPTSLSVLETLCNPPTSLPNLRQPLIFLSVETSVRFLGFYKNGIS